MSNLRAPLPEALGEVFTIEQAMACGVSRGRLRCDDLEHPFRGVYRRRDLVQHARLTQLPPRQAWAFRQCLRAEEYALILPPGAFFTGRTAAAMWGLPVPRPRHDDIEVGVCAPDRAIRRAGVRGSQIRPHLVQLGAVRGLPVLTPASIWAVLGPRLALHDRVALGDAVLKHTRIPGTQRREHRPLGSVEELQLLTAAPRPGAPMLRKTIPLLVTASASPPESHLRVRLQQWGFPEPSLDLDVYALSGRLLGCSEIAFPQYRVACEYEGEHHRIDSGQWARDIEKYHDYAACGWSVVRVTAQLLYRQPEVLRARIDAALRLGGWDGRIGRSG